MKFLFIIHHFRSKERNCYKNNYIEKLGRQENTQAMNSWKLTDDIQIDDTNF